MSISYSLHIHTGQSLVEVLKKLFEIDKVETVPNSDVNYVRGIVFLAHGKSTGGKTQTRYQEQFGITPTISILFFPDGVSDHDTALNLLAQAINRWLINTEDDVLLLANNTTEIMKRQVGHIIISEDAVFWTPDRLQYLSQT